MGRHGIHWTQILILAAFMGTTAVSWIWTQMRDQTQKKRARDTARKRYEEQLRTGRAAELDPAPPSTPPMTRAQQLAARRRTQLEELRRRQRGQETQQGPLAAPRPSTLVTSPRGGMARPTGRPPLGVVIQRTPLSTPGGLGVGMPVQRPRQPATRPTRTPARPRPRAALVAEHTPEQQRRLRRQYEQERQQTEEARGKSIQASRIAAEAEARAPRLRTNGVRSLLFGPDGRRRNAAHLRDLIAVAEVLGRPMSLKNERELPWHGW